MTHINKFLGFLMVLALAAFALPASAQTKQYSLDISTDGSTFSAPDAAVTIPAGGVKVYWTVGNQTPSGGNSAIGSWVIKKAPGYKISGPYGGPPSAIFDDQTQPGNLRVSNVGPIVPKSNQSGIHYVTITFTLTPEDACTSAAVNWNQYTVVTTGTFSNSAFGYVGNTFTDWTLTQRTTTQYTTFTASGCFAVNGVASPLAGGTVACSPANVQPGGNSTCTATANSGYFLTGFSGSPIACVQIGTTNQCLVSNVTQDTTTIGGFSQSAGKVGCISGNVPNTGSTNNYDSSLGKTNFSYDPDKSNVPVDDGWGLRRGNNKDDAPCVLVDYQFTPAANTNGFVASLLFDQTSGQKASWKYLIVWPNAVAVDSTNPNKGWTTWRPQVSWGIVNPTPHTTDFVPALFCTDDVADVDITTLTGAQLAGRLPVIPNDCPLGPYCTSPNAQFQPGQTAKVCVIRHGVTTGPLNTLFPFTEALDEADGYFSPP